VCTSLCVASSSVNWTWKRSRVCWQCRYTICRESTERFNLYL